MTETYGDLYGAGPFGSESTEDGPPRAFSFIPAVGEIDVDRDALVRFRMSPDVIDPWTVVVDQGSGFALALTHNGGATFEAAYDGVESNVAIGTEIEVVIDKVDLFVPYSLITVRITAQDIDGHPIEI